MGLLQRLRRWWHHRQLVDLLMEQLEQGSGVASQSWACGTTTEQVLAWYDDQLASSRTPYGVCGFKLAILAECGPPLYEVVLNQRAEWLTSRRAEIRAALTPLLAERQITTAVIAFGTALHHLMQ